MAAASLPSEIKKIFGKPVPPQGIDQYSGPDGDISGLILLLNNLLKVIIFAAGIFALINFLISAIQYVGSSGNPELLKQASSRIWISLLGLVIIAGSIVLAAVIGLLFYGDATAILIPTFLTPGP